VVLERVVEEEKEEISAEAGVLGMLQGREPETSQREEEVVVAAVY
jgi:hypothetical protein